MKFTCYHTTLKCSKTNICSMYWMLRSQRSVCVVLVVLYLVPSSASRNASKCFGCLWSLHQHNAQNSQQISIESIECQYNNNDDDNTYTNISKLQNVHNPPSRRRLQSLGGSTGKVLWTTWKGELSDLSDFCVPVDTVSGWQHLCLATVKLLYVPRVGWLVFNGNFSTKKAISYHRRVVC